MVTPLVGRGQVYKHWQYRYPARNIEDKLILVLNKTYLPGNPIIVVPTSTNKSGRKYSLGCNQSASVFYVPANVDFFDSDTQIQLVVLNSEADIPESEFIRLQSAGTIGKTPEAILKLDTIGKLVACVKRMKEDIREDYQQYLF